MSANSLAIAQANEGHGDAALVIGPASSRSGIDLKELWSYRGLLLFLLWRDIKVRYAQTVMGAAWAVLQPLLTTVVFTVVFGSFAKIPSDGLPYAVFSLAALVPWTYFSSVLANASGSLVASSNLITKVYFPRLVIPLAAVLAGLVDLLVAMTILLVVMLGYGIVPHATAGLVIPVLVLAMMMTAAGMGAWLAALNIRYRDVKYIVPFLVQVWMYASPIVYPISLVPARFRVICELNPLTGVIEGFRAVLLGTHSIPWRMIQLSLGSGLVCLVLGVAYFQRTEHLFADVA